MNGSSRATRAAITLSLHGEAAHDAGGEVDHGVGGEERVLDHQAAVRRVVEAALEPLRRRVERTVERVGEQTTRQAAHPLGADRVALVGHRRRAHLRVAERLGQLAHALEQAQVGAELVHALADAGERREHLRVLLAWIGLTGDRPAAIEAERARDAMVELLDAPVIAVEEGEEARLRSGRALDAAAAQARQAVVDRRHVLHHVLEPQAGALAHRGELRRLEVRVGEGGEGRGAQRERAQLAGESEQPAAHAAAARRAASRTSVLSVM